MPVASPLYSSCPKNAVSITDGRRSFFHDLFAALMPSLKYLYVHHNDIVQSQVHRFFAIGSFADHVESGFCMECFLADI